MESLPRIFVSIASFRDTECQHTVRDLFLKADHPERLSVGICWQFDPAADDNCFQVPPPYPSQVRDRRYAVRDSKGSCWARAQALSLWDGEDYILQIDAHMRFVRGWDSKIVHEQRRCPSKQAIVSTLTYGYSPPHKLFYYEGTVPLTYVYKLGDADDLQPIYLRSHLVKMSEAGFEPLPSAFIIGNFSFAPAAAFRDIPFDPHIFFRGQEPVYSARLWTHGWDIYNPSLPLIFHYWDYPGPDPGETVRYKESTPQALMARQRVRHLLGVEKAQDAKALVEIDKYGMGAARTLEAYWDFCGVDLGRGIVAEKAASGRWPRYIR